MKAMTLHPSNTGSMDISIVEDMKSLQRLQTASNIVAGDTDCYFETTRALVLGNVEEILRRRGRREGSTKIMVIRRSCSTSTPRDGLMNSTTSTTNYSHLGVCVLLGSSTTEATPPTSNLFSPDGVR